MYAQSQWLLEGCVHRDVVHQWAWMVSPVVSAYTELSWLKVGHLKLKIFSANWEVGFTAPFPSCSGKLSSLVVCSWGYGIYVGQPSNTLFAYLAYIWSMYRANCLSDNHLGKEPKKGCFSPLPSFPTCFSLEQVHREAVDAPFLEPFKASWADWSDGWQPFPWWRDWS